MMKLKIVLLIFCGYNVIVDSSRLGHIQSCGQASLDTQCLLTYIQTVTGQLVAQNEQLLVNTIRHLANKSELYRFGTQMELVAQNITSQNDHLSTGIENLATKTELDNVIGDLTGYIQALALKGENVDIQMERMSQKVTNQNELLYNGLELLATKIEIDHIIEELTGPIRAVTGIVTKASDQIMLNLATKTELGNVERELSRQKC